MSRAEPLITPEELQCLLGGAPVRSNTAKRTLLAQLPSLHWAAALWLVKGIFLSAVLMSPDAANLVGSSRYLWMRGCLELVCLSVFWGDPCTHAAKHSLGPACSWPAPPCCSMP